MIKEILSDVSPHAFIYRILRWHLLYFVNKKPRPLGSGFFVTSKCNFRCEFCNIWRLKPHFTLQQEDARRIIRQFGDVGLIYFSITGGEPLLVPYVFDLLAYAKECGILYTHVVSNGFLMDAAKAKSMAEARVSEISFSLDGPEEAHDRMRNMSGAFQGVLSAVDHVKTHAPKTRIVLNTVLTFKNPEYALFAAEKARELDVSIKFQPASDHPVFDHDNSAESNKQYQGEESFKNLLEAIDVLNKAPHVVNSRPFLKHYRNLLLSSRKGLLHKTDCVFGYHHIEFFNNRLFPCLEGLDWKHGFDLSTGELSSILSSAEYSAVLKNLRKCQACLSNYYICYNEPRLNFPIWNFILSRATGHRITRKGERSVR